jgi:phosphoglycolate phosphatase
MKKAIFFDLDGTLWDAINEIKDSWNEAMKELHEPYSFTYEKMKSFMGLTPLETVPLAFPGVSIDKGLKLFKACFNNEIKYLKTHLGKLYPNEEIILKELSKKYSLYIVSNADVGYIDNYVNGYQFNAIYDGLLCAGDTGFPKYKNIIYLKEKEKIDEVIYVGDTEKDLIESTKANVKFIHAAYGFGVIKDDKNYINSLKELPALVDKIFSEYDSF